MKKPKRKPQGPDVMDQARAARGYLNASDRRKDDGLDMFAFLQIFHPKMPADKARALANGSRRGA